VTQIDKKSIEVMNVYLSMKMGIFSLGGRHSDVVDLILRVASTKVPNVNSKDKATY
jgi:hypothetical protein